MKAFSSILFIFLSLFVCSFSLSRTHKKLNDHGVSGSMQKAINGLTASGLQKENIIKNIQSHYPEKTRQEINDVVVLANAASGRNQPRKSDNSKAAKNKLLKQKQDFSKNLNKLNKRKA